MEIFRMSKEEKEERSAFSSGCEYGWTVYFDQSSERSRSLYQKKDLFEEEEEVEKEEDLSMISDASSGPPHIHDDDFFCYCNYGEFSDCFCNVSSSSSAAGLVIRRGSKRRRLDAELQQEQKMREESCGFLDDTASSHLLSYPKENFHLPRNQPVGDVSEISYGFSGTHFKEKSFFHMQLDCLQPISAVSNCSSEKVERKRQADAFHVFRFEEETDETFL